MIWEITGGVANQPNAPRVEFGYGSPDGWFDAVIVEDDERVVSSPSSEVVTTEDRNNIVYASGTFAQNFLVQVTDYPRPDGSANPVITLATTNGLQVSTVSPNKIETKDDGNSVANTVILTSAPRTLELPIVGKTRSSGGSSVVFESFVSGSLAHHCEGSVNNRIAGATTDMLPIFTNYSGSHASGNYTRNPDSWAYDIRQAMTCISPWNSRGINTRAGTALTQRHMGFVAHGSYYPKAGDTIRMVTADNVTVTRTIVSTKVHPSYSVNGNTNDIVIGLLDSDWPESITPCKLLPANYADYLPTGPKHIACLCLDKEEKALVTDLDRFDLNYAVFRYPDQPYEQVLYESKIVGDSGNPAFLIINNELVCISLWTFGGAGSGTFLTPQIAAMNQMIADLDAAAGIDTGYTIQTVDLSGFTDFS